MQNVNKAFEELKRVSGEISLLNNGINILKKAVPGEATMLNFEIEQIMDTAKKYGALVWFDTNPSKTHYPGIAVKIRLHDFPK